MNRVLLDFARLVSRKPTMKFHANGPMRREGGHRSTFVDVNFVTPKPPPFSQRLLWICRVTLLVEFGLQLGDAASMGLHRLARGAALMTCMAINLILMSILRETWGLKFDGKTDVEFDAQKTSTGRAALGVYIVTSS